MKILNVNFINNSIYFDSSTEYVKCYDKYTITFDNSKIIGEYNSLNEFCTEFFKNFINYFKNKYYTGDIYLISLQMYLHCEKETLIKFLKIFYSNTTENTLLKIFEKYNNDIDFLNVLYDINVNNPNNLSMIIVSKLINIFPKEMYVKFINDEHRLKEIKDKGSVQLLFYDNIIINNKLTKDIDFIKKYILRFMYVLRENSFELKKSLYKGKIVNGEFSDLLFDLFKDNDLLFNAERDFILMNLLSSDGLILNQLINIGLVKRDILDVINQNEIDNYNRLFLNSFNVQANINIILLNGHIKYFESYIIFLLIETNNILIKYLFINKDEDIEVMNNIILKWIEYSIKLSIHSNNTSRIDNYLDFIKSILNSYSLLNDKINKDELFNKLFSNESLKKLIVQSSL